MVENDRAEGDENGEEAFETGSLLQSAERIPYEMDSESVKVKRPVELEVRENDSRPVWSKKLEFILACVGYAVGLGNVWRFPYLCYISGGGAFLIPYFIMLCLCGIPLFYMELAVGQYTRMGPIGALEKICPLLKGAGLGTVVLSYLLCTYYNVIIAWAAYYFFHSFSFPQLPWATCNNTWNTHLCWDDLSVNGTKMRPNNSVSPSEEYFKFGVLQQTDGLDNPGVLRWDLTLILLGSWAVVYFCLFKGIKSTGKVVYFTATFPYLVLIILFVRGVTLPGALDGILFFIRPKWNLLLDATVWVNAAAQNFNSIGIAFGSLIAMSSYNKFDNRIFKDVMSVACINAATSLFAGFVIFSILGNIALSQGKDVEDVVDQGPGLVFVAYPAAFVTMSVPQLWSALFFFMLLCLGIDSQFCMVEVIVTSLSDHYGPAIYKYLRRREILVLVVCVVSFFLGLPNVTEGGIYFFRLIDYYAAGVSLMYIAFFEVLAICWIYGGNRLARNVREMTGALPFMYFRICWYVFAPLLILAIWIFGWIQYKPVTYDDYVYPVWGQVLGWAMASCSILCIPGGAVHAVYKAEGDTMWEKFKCSLQSTMEEPDMSVNLVSKATFSETNGFHNEGDIPLKAMDNKM